MRRLFYVPQNCEQCRVAGYRAYGLWSVSEKTRESDHLQVALSTHLFLNPECCFRRGSARLSDTRADRSAVKTKHYVWLVPLLLAQTPTMNFLRSHKRNRKKWKRSDSFELMASLVTLIFNFHRIIRAPTFPTSSLEKTNPFLKCAILRNGMFPV